MKNFANRLVSFALVLVMLMSTSILHTGAADDSYLVKGIDLSYWDEDADFQTLKSRGIRYVILRAYSYKPDQRFEYYYDKAVENDMPVGAYIYMYAKSVKNAEAEARATLKVLDGRRLDFPLYLDVEDKTIRELSKSTLTDCVIAELNIFKEAGYDVGIYSAHSFFRDEMDMTRLQGYDLWDARWTCANKSKLYYYSDQDPFGSSKPDAEMWQFSDRGDAKYYGVKATCLDLSYCYYDYFNNLKMYASVNPDDYIIPTRTLSYNEATPMTGDDVRWTQAVLYNLGYSVHVGGTFTSYMKKVVQQFQKDNGISATGNIASQTLNRLLELHTYGKTNFKLYYNDSNGSGSLYTQKLPYESSYKVAGYSDFKNEGNDLLGWNIRRATDNKWLANDGQWYAASKIAGQKKLIKTGDELFLNYDYPSGTTNTEKLVFQAVWQPHYSLYKTITYKGNTYKVYNGSVSFNEADSYAKAVGGHLVTFASSGEYKAVITGLNKSSYFTNGKKSENVWTWFNDDAFSYKAFTADSDADGSENLVVSNKSGSYKYHGVKSDYKAKGFIVEFECTHPASKLVSVKKATCVEKGYSGDRKCSSCGVILEKGASTAKTAHKYGDWKVVTKATQSADGKKKQSCIVCGKEKTAVISKIKTISSLKSKYTYTGKEVKPTFTIKNSAGSKLVLNKDYTLTYKNNIKVGKSTVKITFKGMYSGSKTFTFTIAPAAPTGINCSSVSKNSCKLDWKKSAGATYYTVQKSTDKNKWSTVSTVKTNSITVKNLKYNVRYYFRIVALNSDKTVKSSYSVTYSVKTR